MAAAEYWGDQGNDRLEEDTKGLLEQPWQQVMEFLSRMWYGLKSRKKVLRGTEEINSTQGQVETRERRAKVGSHVLGLGGPEAEWMRRAWGWSG